MFSGTGRFLEVTVEILARQVVPVQKHQDAVLQKRQGVFGGGRTEAALACEKRKIVKIVLCSHKCILDLHDGSEGQGAELFRLSGEAQIELALFKHLQRVVGGLTGNSDPEVRMKLDEILQRRQKDVFAEGRADPDAQLAHTELMAQAQLVFRAFERLQGGSDMGEKKLTVFCQPHSPGRSGQTGARPPSVPASVWLC